MSAWAGGCVHACLFGWAPGHSARLLPDPTAPQAACAAHRPRFPRHLRECMRASMRLSVRALRVCKRARAHVHVCTHSWHVCVACAHRQGRWRNRTSSWRTSCAQMNRHSWHPSCATAAMRKVRATWMCAHARKQQRGVGGGAARHVLDKALDILVTCVGHALDMH